MFLTRRDLSSTPPRSIIVPKARTPMSSSYQEKLSSVENLLCEIVTRLDQLECCSRHGVNKRRFTQFPCPCSFASKLPCLQPFLGLAEDPEANSIQTS